MKDERGAPGGFGAGEFGKARSEAREMRKRDDMKSGGRDWRDGVKC